MIKVIVIGASSGGEIVGEALLRQSEKYDLVGYLDSKIDLHNKKVHGKKVFGGLDKLEELVLVHQLQEVIVAISNIEPEFLSEVTRVCNSSNVDLRVIPKVLNVFLEDSILNQLKPVEVEDLLGREPIEIDSGLVAGNVCNKTILVTGASGSIGSEVVRQVVKFWPKKILALDVNENELYLLELFIRRHYKSIEFQSVVASIQDKNFIEALFLEETIDLVYHCAAHKHVPMLESYPVQAVKNNVLGTLIVGEAAKLNKVDRFVLVSTDKAVNPTNCMGASKRLAELVALSLNGSNTKFMAVRFGNVLGSAGSVVPIFKQLLKEGRNLTITDERMTRYFMTIPEAARLVIEAGFRGEGKELFLLDMGQPIRIVDLAKNMIKLSGAKVAIDYVGLRPGEKLYEELFYDEDKIIRTANSKIMISTAEFDETISLDLLIEGLIKVISGELDAREYLRNMVPSAALR